MTVNEYVEPKMFYIDAAKEALEEMPNDGSWKYSDLESSIKKKFFTLLAFGRAENE